MVLTLYAGTTRLGTLTYKDMDWPRMYYDFEPTPEFENFREALDMRGSSRASPEAMQAGEKMDLRVTMDNGECMRLHFIFINGTSATIRQGLIRE